MVVIAGAITRADQAKGTFQEVDQVALFAPISKRSVVVTDPTRLVPMVEDATRLSNSGRRGPVVLHVPRCLFSALIPAIDPTPVTVSRAGPATPKDILAIADMLAGAERPVIFAGAASNGVAGERR